MKHSADYITKDLLFDVASEFDIAVPNYYLGRFECDLLRISKTGMATEYEIKVSKADFRKDAEKFFKPWNGEAKTKHDILKSGKRVNRFYFVVPEGMVDPSEVPDEFGLIYASPAPQSWTGRKYIFKIVKKGKWLTKDPAKPELLAHIARNLSVKLFYAKRDKWIAVENAKNTRKFYEESKSSS